MQLFGDAEDVDLAAHTFQQLEQASLELRRRAQRTAGGAVRFFRAMMRRRSRGLVLRGNERQCALRLRADDSNSNNDNDNDNSSSSNGDGNRREESQGERKGNGC